MRTSSGIRSKSGSSQRRQFSRGTPAIMVRRRRRKVTDARKFRYGHVTSFLTYACSFWIRWVRIGRCTGASWMNLLELLGHFPLPGLFVLDLLAHSSSNIWGKTVKNEMLLLCCCCCCREIFLDILALPCDAFRAFVAGEWTEGDRFLNEVSFRRLLAVSFWFLLSSFTTTTMAKAVSSIALIQDCMLDSPSA